MICCVSCGRDWRSIAPAVTCRKTAGPRIFMMLAGVISPFAAGLLCAAMMAEQRRQRQGIHTAAAR